MISKPRIIAAFARVLVVAAAGALVACAGSSPPDASSAAASATAPAAAPRPPPAGRNTSPPATPAPVVAGPQTTINARADCWMKLEADKKAPRDLDQRVKLVEACVAAKLGAQPTPTTVQ